MAFATAPGKLMLFGEHAVVHGQPCIVTAVDLRVQARAERSERPELFIESRKGGQVVGQFRAALSDLAGITRYPSAVAFVLAAAQGFIAQTGFNGGVRIETDGPAVSYGLGSSSAVTAAALAALHALAGDPLDRRALFEQAYAAVLAVQGKGSGFDVASAVWGGTLVYARGGEIIRPLDLPALPVVIAYSGEKVSTVKLLNAVDDLIARCPDVTGGIFRGTGEIVARAEPALLAGDWPAVGRLMDENQALLRGLGVSTPKLDGLIAAARRAGAWGAKLSGAGGGDCMFALVSPEKRGDVEKALEAAGGQVLNLGLGVSGVEASE